MPKQLVNHTLKQKLKLLNTINLELFTKNIKAIRFDVDKNKQEVYLSILIKKGIWHKYQIMSYMGDYTFSLHQLFVMQTSIGNRKYKIIIDPVASTLDIHNRSGNLEGIIAKNIPFGYEITQFNLHTTVSKLAW